MFVNTVSAVYVDERKIDLFGQDSKKLTNREERRRKRQEWESAHESEEDLRIEKEFQLKMKIR